MSLIKLNLLQKYTILFVLLNISKLCHSQNLSLGKTNIIYIYADDMGYGELGCYGQELISTPNLDQMAKEGIKFTQHYSSSPVCAPARAMLLSGKHSGHSYIRGNYELGGFTDSLEAGQMPLPERFYSIPQMLKEAGYTTGIIGKWGLGMSNSTGAPHKQGFDYSYGYVDQKQAHNYYPTHLWENGKWDSLKNKEIFVHKRLDPKKAQSSDFQEFTGNDYAPEKMTKKALKFIEEHHNKPFFLYLPYTIPHVGLQVPEEYLNKYLGKFKGEKPYYGENGYNPSEYPLSTYAAMITFLDDQVGIILRRLKDLGLDENTLVMFSSDNGTTFNGGVDPTFFNSVAGLKGLKMDLYEGGIRVPFIARWPTRIKKNQVCDQISVQYDIMATLGELIGRDDLQTDGVSLLPILLGEIIPELNNRYIYFEYPENGGQIAIRMGKWKGIKIDVRKSGYEKSNWQLYNIEDDPNESINLSHQHPKILLHFDEIVKREHIPPHIREWEFVDPKHLK